MKHNGNDSSQYIDGASEYEFDNISRICCLTFTALSGGNQIILIGRGDAINLAMIFVLFWTKLVFKKQNCLFSTTKFQKDLKGKTIEIKSYCYLKQMPTAFSSPLMF